MPRPRYAAISFQESSRPSSGTSDPGNGAGGWSSMTGQDSADTRQNTPDRLWHLVALEQRKTTPHTGPTFDAGRSSRRCSVVNLLFVVLTVGLLASQGTAAPSKRQS